MLLASGAWGEIIQHVRAADAIISTRVFHVLVREASPLAAFDDSLWGELYGAAAIPLDDQVAHYALRRAELLRALRPQQWTSSGQHELAGTLTVADICQTIVEHEAEHRAQLEQIIATGREA